MYRFTVTVPVVITGASTLTIPATGGWNAWSNVDVGSTLTAGVHTVKLRLNAGNTGGANIDNLTVITTASAAATTTTTVAPPTTVAPGTPLSSGCVRGGSGLEYAQYGRGNR
jgi:hypothetical protein